MVDVSKVAAQLDFLANHFVEEPWKVDDPDAEHTVKGLTTSWVINYNKLSTRVKRASTWIFHKNSQLDHLFYELDERSVPFFIYKIQSNFRMFLYHLKKESNKPDYSLRDGTVVAVWAETGDYLISVQPAVGDKVAKFLRENPTNPYAIEVAEEIQKGWDAAYPDQRHKTMYKETE